MDEKKELFSGTIRYKELMHELNDRLLALYQLVSQMIKRGTIALLEENEALFRELKEELVQVHEYRDALESAVISSLALHQPFARDLRYILSSLKISEEIHRCGHDAVHIARSSQFFNRKAGRYNEIVQRIGKLAKLSLKMFDRSMEAFLNRKALEFKEWAKLDDEVDDLHEEIIEEISKIMKKYSRGIRTGVSLILATRYIERIADHACNIVEESAFVVTSKREVID